MSRAIANAGEETRPQQALRQGAVIASIEASKRNVLCIICWLLVAGPAIFLTASLLMLPGRFGQAPGPALVLLLACSGLVLIRLGQARAAAFLVVYGVWLAVAAHAFLSGGGIHTPQLVAMPLGIMLSGWLLGARHAVAVTALSVGFGFALLLHPGGADSLPPLLVLLPRTVVAVGVCVLTLYIVRTYEARLADVRRLGEALAEEKAQLRELAENVPALIFHGDRDMRCLFANRQFADFFHGGGVPLEGMHLREILGEAVFEGALPNIRSALAGERVLLDGERLSKAGGMRHLEISLVPQHDAAGAVIGFYALKRDITERLEAERSMREQHAFLDALTRAQSEAGLALFVIEAGRLTYANEAACGMFGYSREELCALPSYLELAHPEDRERIAQNHLRRLRGERFDNNYRIGVVTKSGERREADLTAAYMPGDVPRVLVILADATERKRIEEELRRSEQKFSQVFKSSPTAISLTRMADGLFIDVNAAWTRLFGWNREEVIGRKSTQLGIWLSEEDRRAWIEAMRHTPRPEGYEARLRNRLGRILPILFSTEVVELDGEPCLLGLSIDLSEQKAALAALQESERRLREAQRIARLGSWELDLASNTFSFTDEIENIYDIQVDRDALTYETFLKTLPREEREGFNRRFGEAVRAGRKGEFTYRPRLRDGRVKHVHVRYEARLDDDGRPQKVVGTTQDVTEQAIAEERFTKIFKASPLPATISRADSGQFIDVNPAAVRFGGWSREEMIGHTSLDLDLWPDPRQRQEALEKLQRDGSLRDIEITYRTRSGELRATLVSAELLELEGAPCILTLIHDVTERRHAAEAVRRLNDELEQRVRERTAQLSAANRELESFAYSISHDLRAPLRGIDGFTHLLAEEYGGQFDEQGRGYLDRVRRAAQRMGHLIDDILELSRVTRQEMRRLPVDLSQIAAELIEERARAEPGRRVEAALAPDCIALGDPQLLRVLMQNLIENAWKYSRKADPARIALGQETIDGETVFFVRDNGVGFDMKYAQRLFAPFQRLHSPEEFEGTGIGLATVARIVQRHGGRVWAEAEPDKGATLRFILPATFAGE